MNATVLAALFAITPPLTPAGWVPLLMDEHRVYDNEEARRVLGPDGPFGTAAIPALIDALTDDGQIGYRVRRVLTDHGPAAVPGLVAALKRPEGRVRAWAADVLGNIRPRPVEAVPALIAAMSDADPTVRSEAVRSLGRMKPAAERIVPVLLATLKGTDDDLRAEAAFALGGLVREPGPAVAALVAMLKDDKLYPRIAALNSLGEIGPAAKDAVPALAELARGKTDSPREIVLRTLDPVSPVVRPLIELVWGKADDFRVGAIFALAKIGPAAKDAVPALVTVIRDVNELVRHEAVVALGCIQSAEAVPALIAVLKSEDHADGRFYYSKDDPVTALGRIGPAARAAVPVLIALLDDGERRDSLYTVIDALGEIGPDSKPAVPALVRIIRNRAIDQSVRKAAAEAVAKIDPPFAAKEKLEFACLDIRLGERLPVALKPRPPAADETARIKGLIAQLAEIDRPDFGLSGTLSGSQPFAPLPGRGRMQVGLITNHQLGTSPAFRTLVELGPAALPHLLAGLDDPTPTKLTIYSSGVMFIGGGSVEGNPFSPAERRAAALKKPAPARKDDDEDMHPSSYTVKVGDVCYVAVGQIVGRSYVAVQYIPTAIVAVTSATGDAGFRDQLRAAWGGPDPTKLLLDSLLTDYATEDIFDGRPNAGPDEGSRYQVEAAVRLLYYFPDEAAPPIAARLKALDVLRPPTGNRTPRDAKNGVRTAEFVRAVAWCPAAPVRAALADLARRTDDPLIREALATGRTPAPPPRPAR